MIDLSFLSGFHRSQLEAELPWIWLYELETGDDPPQRYRLTNFPQKVNFGANSDGVALTYTPAPVVHGAVEQTADGSLPTLSFTVANTGPILASTVDQAEGFVERPCRITLISAYELENPAAAIVENAEVESCRLTAEGIAFKVSAFSLYQLQSPPFLFARRRCRYAQFGGPRCGYNKEAAGAAFDSCPRTVEACKERGDDEVARGLTRQHPSRFGAFPGIPRAR